MYQVSVIILSYNNLTYLEQAINSVLIQDYANIQLIVSDDCSDFFDVNLVNQYIDKVKKNNIRHFIVSSNEKNMGTVRNLNNALMKATGEIIVPFAADDVLHDSTVISNFVKRFEEDSSLRVLTSQVHLYDVNLENCVGVALSENYINVLLFSDFSRLYGELALNCFIPSGGTAYRRILFDQQGYFDEALRLVEDWPYFLKLTRTKVKIGYGDFISAKHRDNGVSKNTAGALNEQYQTDLIHVIEQEILQNIEFAPVNMQKVIATLCTDKIIYYNIRFNFKKWGTVQKVKYIFENRIFEALIRGIRRSRKR